MGAWTLLADEVGDFGTRVGVEEDRRAGDIFEALPCMSPAGVEGTARRTRRLPCWAIPVFSSIASRGRCVTASALLTTLREEDRARVLRIVEFDVGRVGPGLPM